MAADPRIGTFPWYVPVGVTAFVVNAWVESGVSLHAATRAVLIAGLASLLLLAVVGLALGRRWQQAGLLIGALALILSGIHLDVIGVAGRIGGWQGWLWISALAIAAALLVSIGMRRFRGPEGLERLTRALNSFAIALALVVVVMAWTDGAVAAAATELLESPPSASTSGSAAHPPDIYVLLLDAYPRADTLAERFDFDNEPFLSALRGRGFTVAEDSRTNYMFTQLVLLSFFQMRPASVADLEGPIDTTAHVNRAVRASINRADGIELLREHGYRIVASNPGYESVVLRDAADEFLDDGQANEFERHLVRRTLLIDVLGLAAPQWLPDQHRSRVHSNFEDAGQIARADHDQPTFAFIHVASPHTPNIFAADGSALPVSDLRAFYGDTPELMKVSRDKFKAQVRGQISYLNTLVESTVDEILDASDGTAVILVMSDHGTRMDVTFGDPDDADLDERMQNLFASYTPGHDDLFGDAITPVNVLPILFNAYLGTDLPCHPNDAFANGPGNLFDLHPLAAASAVDGQCASISETAS